MTVNYLYSDAKAQEALAVIGDERIATTERDLVRQIIRARCAVNGESVQDALGGSNISNETVPLLKQLTVVTA